MSWRRYEFFHGLERIKIDETFARESERTYPKDQDLKKVFFNILNKDRLITMIVVAVLVVTRSYGVEFECSLGLSYETFGYIQDLSCPRQAALIFCFSLFCDDVVVSWPT